MSYLTQPATSNRKFVALGIALLLHVALGYAFYTGLAQDVIKQVVKPLEAVAVEEPEELEEPPPPPEEQLEEVVVQTPPPMVTIETPPPPTAIVTQTTIIRPAPPAPIAPPAPPVVTAPTPAPAPAPVVAASPAKLRGNRLRLITNDDYPEASIRAEEQGTTSVKYDVNEQGRVENCVVTQTSSSRRLDELTCTLITRRFRFEPAKAQGGTPMRETKADRVKWQVPED